MYPVRRWLVELLDRMTGRSPENAPRTRTITGPAVRHPSGDHPAGLPDVPPDFHPDTGPGPDAGQTHEEISLATELRDRGVHPGGRP